MRRVLLATIASAVMVLMSASAYALWTPYRAGGIEGMQGRHFLPLAPLLPLLCHGRRFSGISRMLDSRRARVGLGVLLAVAYLATMRAVIRRFYVSGGRGRAASISRGAARPEGADVEDHFLAGEDLAPSTCRACLPNYPLHPAAGVW